jgi:hypothetical protein
MVEGMGNDGFVWMDDSDRRRGSTAGEPGPARTPKRRPGEPLVAHLVDEAWASSAPPEPTLREIGAQLRLWLAGKVRRVRRTAPRWALDRIAARLSF